MFLLLTIRVTKSYVTKGDGVVVVVIIRELDLELPMQSVPITTKFWVRIPLMRSVLDSTVYDQVCQWLATGRWLSPGTPMSSPNNTDRHDITEILLKVALNIISLAPSVTKLLLLVNYCNSLVLYCTCMLLIFVIVCGVFEWGEYAGFYSVFYIYIAFGDQIIKREWLKSQWPS